ncbi:hypothetical protein DXT76_06565 [Halobacillus trueperi]|uniref:DUF4358 domain-containing protein n=1 Tax=Halobacillus trueperi TaxID=156205 RepID=A0A3D8VR03_9BACI|nr:hypothetical protein [Halobacillus trueperi]RDY71661.1 hypothetical protein DXT76_06565 [Halobacillus trueperi]
MIKKIFFYVFIISVLSACSQQSVKEEDLITLEEVQTAITDQGLVLEDADLPRINAFTRELNGVSPEAFFIDGDTLSIYVFPSTDARKEGMDDFEEKSAAAGVVEHEKYMRKNILVFYELGNEETNSKLKSAINGLE